MAECTEAPVCPMGQAQVEACPADGECQAVTACGQTVQCVPEQACLAACPQGRRKADACPADAECQSVTACDETFECVAAEDPQCQAYPACAAGDFQFDTCPPDTDCAPVTVCGFTIYCVTPTCAPEWLCAENEAPVAGFCEDGRCGDVASCGVPAWCVRTDFATCDALPPDCPDGWQEVPACDPGDPRCLAVPGCDWARLCVPADVCAERPTCPSGVASDGCSADAPCEQRVACGEVLFCVGAQAP